MAGKRVMISIFTMSAPLVEKPRQGINDYLALVESYLFDYLAHGRDESVRQSASPDDEDIICWPEQNLRYLTHGFPLDRDDLKPTRSGT